MRNGTILVAMLLLGLCEACQGSDQEVDQSRAERHPAVDLEQQDAGACSKLVLMAEAPSLSDTFGDAGPPDPSAAWPEPVFVGDYNSDSPVSLDELSCYASVTGELHIDSGMGSIHLPRLELIGGSLTIENTLVTEVVLPRLRRIGGNFWFNYNLELLEIDAEQLEVIGKRVWLHRNPVLNWIGLERLEEFGVRLEDPSNEVHISNNFDLAECLIHATFPGYLPTAGDMPADCECGTSDGRLRAVCP